MKLMSNLAKEMLPEPSKGKIVELIATIDGWSKLTSPTLSTDLECTVCSNREHYAVCVDPVSDHRRVWICANGFCETNKRSMKTVATTTLPKPQRAILWPKFCEINGIGDIYHDLKFEDIKQSDGKVSHLLKFAGKPYGLIFMQGDPGTGKTFASMAVCELFTRKETSCIFCTQRQMLNQWLDTFKPDKYSSFIERVTNISLLVIDDFGTAEISSGFMAFFMDLINTRMQWTNRGTIITTNLDSRKFNEYCGEALADRILEGQRFEFKGQTRRIKKPL